METGRPSDAYQHADSLHDAHEQAIRRIQELRERGFGTPPSPPAPAAPAPALAPPPPAAPELRTLLVRAEAHVGELRTTAQDMAALLPTRVEAAVTRALGEDVGGLGHRLDEVRNEVFETAGAIDRIERDLLAERLGRIEDLEVIVDLLTGSMTAIRADIARLAGQIEEIGARLDAPLQLRVERERPAVAPAPAADADRATDDA
jgi:hypothetical protein